MRYRTIEFWVVTGIVIFIIFHFVQEAAHALSHYDSYDIYGSTHTYAYRFRQAGFRFDYLQHHTYPLLSYFLTGYFSFLLINFYIYPSFYLRKNYTGAVWLSLLVYLAVVLSFSVTDTWFKPFMMVGFGYFFMKNLVLVVVLFGAYVLYIVLKELVWRLYRSHADYIEALAPSLRKEMLVIGGIWMGILLLCILNYEDEDARDMGSFWFSMVPSAYLIYAINRYWLLPEHEKNRKRFLPYIGKLMAYSLLLYMPFFLLFSLLQNVFHPELFFVFWLGQLLLIGSFSWLIYRVSKKNANQIFTLKKELGKTSADLSFLRSQINPHFLFNALNTLYGTALQENSERTAQGIQMLGDMMRFMLHENHQQKILLSREIEYMRNYIELQSLRTSTSPNIVIQTKIEDVVAERFIAPMLLIPFVENAFKHGISLKNPSWIRVTLHYEQDKLYFDVYNSTHPKQEKDPEKDQSGIGLENVKQRLALLYPDKHELVIRETLEEFFVHLTLQLQSSPANGKSSDEKVSSKGETMIAYESNSN